MKVMAISRGRSEFRLAVLSAQGMSMTFAYEAIELAELGHPEREAAGEA